MTKIAEKMIDFKFYNKFNHYNKDQIVFITDTEIVSYRLDVDYSVQYRTPHNIPNLSQDYVHSKMDHSGYIFIFTKDKIYVFNDNLLGQSKKSHSLDELNNILGAKKITDFRKIVDFHDYKTIGAAVSGTGFLYELR